MKSFDIAKMSDTYVGLYKDLSGGESIGSAVQNLASSAPGDPVLGTALFVGVLPIILGIIGVLACSFVNCGVCCCCRCCCPYARYRAVQRKLDKGLRAYIKRHKVPYNFKPGKKQPRAIMFDAVAENAPAQETREIKRLNALKRTADARFVKAFRCETFGFFCYVAFFCLLLLYFVSIVLLGVGAADTTGMPARMFGAVQEIAVDADDALTAAAAELDDAINGLAGTEGANVLTALLTGTLAEYQEYYQQLYSEADEMHLFDGLVKVLDALIEKDENMNFNNQNSLARWLENLLFWPTTGAKADDSYYQKGEEAAKYLVEEVHSLDDEIHYLGSNVSEIINSLKDIPGMDE